MSIELTASLHFDLRFALGIHEFEAEPQRVAIDVDVVFVPRSFPTRNINETYDYDSLAAVVRQIEAKGRVRLIETVLSDIAHHIANDHEQSKYVIRRFTVSVGKPVVFGNGGSKVTLGPIEPQSFLNRARTKAGA